MKWLEDMRRRDRTGEELRDRPLTFMLVCLFPSVSALGLIYIFAFSDTVKERWQHFYTIFPVVAFLGICLAVAKKKEDRGPLPTKLRRAVWMCVLVVYVIVVLVILLMGISPFARLIDTVRLLCYLGSLAPVPYLAWQLLKSDEGR